ncbi:MAG: putative manganese-dependent inorganic diphosphatase [Treponema sp.]|nr:putative manganese-dependent inorganic diphosphatase [Treponema sp.]
MKNTTYVFGHKNPDTDSVVSAAAFAKLKNLLGEKEYVAARAGKLSPQTEYIFKRFNLNPPEYIPDLAPKAAYYMTDIEKAATVNENEPLWNAASLMQKLGNHVLPVVDSEGKYKSLLHYNVFAHNVLSILNPEHHLNVSTSLSHIIKTINAQPINVVDGDEIQKFTIIVGAASFESFKKTIEAHLCEKLIVLTGDREDLHEFCMEKKIRALVLSGARLPKKEIIEKAKKNGISILVSSFDTASTAMLMSYSSPVSVMSDSSVTPVRKMDTVKKIKSLLHSSPSHSLPVVDDDDKLIGIISENDLLHEPNVQVSLVDHNELTQAVDGIENYRIREIIDHHKIGTIPTKYPITFINRPVGSTATQVANMYREKKISIPVEMAQIMLCGILSDTLILQSATTTDVDREVAEYLSSITDLDIQKLGMDIIAAGSHIGSRSVSEVLSQDMKEYSEQFDNGKITYTASQIEVEDTAEILSRKKEFLDELEITRRSHGGLFSLLLVTDITKLSSVMLIAGDAKFMPFVNLPKKDENVFYLKDVVSRKKQLIPLITEILGQYKSN